MIKYIFGKLTEIFIPIIGVLIFILIVAAIYSAIFKISYTRIIATIFSLAVAYIAYDRVKQINFLTMFPIPPNLAILIKILPYITFILVYLVSTYTKIFFLCMYIAYQLLMKCS